MSELKTSLLEEQAQLETAISTSEAFLNTEKAANNPVQKELVEKQIPLMKQYLGVLKERIALLP